MVPAPSGPREAGLPFVEKLAKLVHTEWVRSDSESLVHLRPHHSEPHKKLNLCALNLCP